MTRLIGLVSACLVAGAVVVSALPADQGQRGGRGGQTRVPPASGQGRGEQSPELQQAREALQRLVAEGKRLQEQLKLDRKAGDRDAVKRDNDAIKQNREDIKRAQERIQQLVNRRGGRGGRDGRGGRSGA